MTITNSRKNEYIIAQTSFTKGPSGSGWALSLLDKDQDGIGINLNYSKIGWPNQTVFKEELSLHDLKRIRDFCNTAIDALSSKSIKTETKLT